jgi:aspartyl-tRNA(Asn)/glutamyl-tRNA(Gln) amidotransferase subunit C
VGAAWLTDRILEKEMSLSRTDVEKIAHLARLAIGESDIDDYATGLSNILALVDQMNAVDTSGIQPLAHPLDAVQRLRADVVSETNQREHFQKIAPQVENGLYLVPQVIE